MKQSLKPKRGFLPKWIFIPLKIYSGQPQAPAPPILIIDETTIRCTHDAGPICQCQEKYDAIKNYKPFIPGGVNPYKKTIIPDGDCLETFWVNLKVGSHDWAMEEPHAVPIKNLSQRIVKEDEENLMYVRKPQYSPYYIEEKLKLCSKNHVLDSDNCYETEK